MYDILYLLSPDNLVHHLKESVESSSRTEPDCRLEELHLWNVECITEICLYVMKSICFERLYISSIIYECRCIVTIVTIVVLSNVS